MRKRAADVASVPGTRSSGSPASSTEPDGGVPRTTGDSRSVTGDADTGDPFFRSQTMPFTDWIQQLCSMVPTDAMPFADLFEQVWAAILAAFASIGL